MISRSLHPESHRKEKVIFCRWEYVIAEITTICYDILA